MGNVLPDRFFWALPPGEEGEAGAPEDTPDDSIAPKNPRHVH
jgi:hydroxymethylpyrimidine/phosphomethylpyrimidine kinase